MGRVSLIFTIDSCSGFHRNDVNIFITLNGDVLYSKLVVSSRSLIHKDLAASLYNHKLVEIECIHSKSRRDMSSRGKTVDDHQILFEPPVNSSNNNSRVEKEE
ncbi:hypothetical protein K502DRAFT_352015 [Neoconidiobolus thromboides FSU 785]|nr:hypothetical protein K502DRAFT_352015 [Neoconidiobolus thromboides FSU 785]